MPRLPPANLSAAPRRNCRSCWPRSRSLPRSASSSRPPRRWPRSRWSHPTSAAVFATPAGSARRNPPFRCRRRRARTMRSAPDPTSRSSPGISRMIRGLVTCAPMMVSSMALALAGSSTDKRHRRVVAVEDADLAPGPDHANDLLQYHALILDVAQQRVRDHRIERRRLPGRGCANPRRGTRRCCNPSSCARRVAIALR